MDFGFTEEQELLRSQIRKLLDGSASIDALREVIQTREGYSPQLWKQLGELGYLGLVIPEAYGGAGLGWVDAIVLLEESGRALLSAPLVSTLTAATAILEGGSEEQKQRWLPCLADGSKVGTLAILDEEDRYDADAVALTARREGTRLLLDGTKRFVPDASAADLFVVAFREASSATPRLAVLESDAPGIEIEELKPIDPSRRLGHLHLSQVPVPQESLLSASPELLPRVIDRATAAISAEMIGSTEAALHLTVEFAKQRVQFGHPIGHFQSVKHPLAEIYVDVESLKSLVYYAGWAIDSAPELVPLAVSEAKAFGSLALSNAGIQGVQLHGAVGYTMEYDIQFFLKRAKWARAMYGDEDFHHDRIAALEGY